LDVFFFEAFKEEAEALEKVLPPQITAGFTWKTIQEYGDRTIPAALISIRTQSVIPINWASELRGILTRSTGYDHITNYLQNCRRQISCGYFPLYCNRSVAEQAAMMWMSLLRKLSQQIQQFIVFNRDGLAGQECLQKTLLVVGVGNIGYEIVRIGQGLGMDVLGVDIVEKHEKVVYVSIEEGIRRADVIVCSMNLTPQNKAYFTYQLLKKARSGIIFVNIARGELSPSTVLLRLLEEKVMGGVALDVYDHESELAVALRASKSSEHSEVKATLALAGHSNVILTPHNAFNTIEAIERKVNQSIQQISHFLESGRFLWPVPTS